MVLKKDLLNTWLNIGHFIKTLVQSLNIFLLCARNFPNASAWKTLIDRVTFAEFPRRIEQVHGFHAISSTSAESLDSMNICRVSGLNAQPSRKISYFPNAQMSQIIGQKYFHENKEYYKVDMKDLVQDSVKFPLLSYEYEYTKNNCPQFTNYMLMNNYGPDLVFHRKVKLVDPRGVFLSSGTPFRIHINADPNFEKGKYFVLLTPQEFHDFKQCLKQYKSNDNYMGLKKRILDAWENEKNQSNQ